MNVRRKVLLLRRLSSLYPLQRKVGPLHYRLTKLTRYQIHHVFQLEFQLKLNHERFPYEDQELFSLQQHDQNQLIPEKQNLQDRQQFLQRKQRLFFHEDYYFYLKQFRKLEYHFQLELLRQYQFREKFLRKDQYHQYACGELSQYQHGQSKNLLYESHEPNNKRDLCHRLLKQLQGTRRNRFRLCPLITTPNRILRDITRDPSNPSHLPLARPKTFFRVRLFLFQESAQR